MRAKCPTPEYTLETEGLVHEPLHSATVLVGGLAVKGPYEPLKKSAEHAAARAAWEALLRGERRMTSAVLAFVVCGDVRDV